MLFQNSVSEKKLNEDDDDDIDGVPITNNGNSNVNTQKKSLPKSILFVHLFVCICCHFLCESVKSLTKTTNGGID